MTLHPVFLISLSIYYLNATSKSYQEAILELKKKLQSVRMLYSVLLLFPLLDEGIHRNNYGMFGFFLTKSKLKKIKGRTSKKHRKPGRH